MNRVLPLAFAIVAGVAATLAAQDSPAIREAVRLAAEGRSQEARGMVAAELARARSGDSAYVEALFWRARLATYGDSAERDLRRVAIEFAASRWADDALLELAQLALVAGNPASALALAERLRSDYPGSELKPRAAYWASRAAFDLGDPGTACALLDSARAEAAAEVEFQNQVAFYRGRCSAFPPAGALRVPAGAGVPPPVRRDSAAPPPRSGPTFAVQVAAVRSERDAEAELSRLLRAGRRGRVAHGADGFFRIRVGSFATEREAQQVARALRRVLGGSPFVVREP